jgi:hypothetical protein
MVHLEHQLHHEWREKDRARACVRFGPPLGRSFQLRALLLGKLHLCMPFQKEHWHFLSTDGTRETLNRNLFYYSVR